MKYKCTNYYAGEIYEAKNLIALLKYTENVIDGEKCKRIKLDEFNYEIRKI